jgi:hypothetical protein
MVKPSDKRRGFMRTENHGSVFYADQFTHRWADQGHPETSPGGELALQQSAFLGSAAMATKDMSQRTPIAEANNQNQQRRTEKWLRRKTF